MADMMQTHVKSILEGLASICLAQDTRRQIQEMCSKIDTEAMSETEMEDVAEQALYLYRQSIKDIVCAVCHKPIGDDKQQRVWTCSECHFPLHKQCANPDRCAFCKCGFEPEIKKLWLLSRNGQDSQP